MSGIVRNLFGDCSLYGSKDYEDFTSKFLFTEKWALYLSGSLATYDVLFARNPPKGFLETASRVLKFVGPVSLAAAVFPAALYASANLRGKKDDGYNSFYATLVSGAAFCSIRRSPTAYMFYIILVGVGSSIFKQQQLMGWKGLDTEGARKHRQSGIVWGPYLIDWTFTKDRPPKWINGDELKKDK